MPILYESQHSHNLGLVLQNLSLTRGLCDLIGEFWHAHKFLVITSWLGSKSVQQADREVIPPLPSSTKILRYVGTTMYLAALLLLPFPTFNLSDQFHIA